MSETKAIQHFVATVDDEGNIRVHVEAGEYVGDFTVADELVEEALAKRRWIKVKDRMPEPDQFVLAYGDTCQGWVDGPKIAVFRWHSETWWDANMDAEFAYGVPTHWMPLPSPPAELRVKELQE